MSSSLWWREKEGMQKTFLELGLGQLVSLNLAVMSFTASLISIEVNKAFQFTSITSVTILDCWTIAWAIILTWIFLGTKYSAWQFFGAAICVAGLGLVLLSDARSGSGSGGGGSNPLLGDFLVITGTILFAMSNVGEEFCAKKKDLTEVIAMIGLFGMLVSASEIPVLERKALMSINWSAGLVSAYAGYALSSFLFYTLAPFISGATLFNLSLLTSDIWAVVVRTFIYKQKVDWLYYPAFLLVVAGIFIYSKTEKGPERSPDIENTNFDPEYHHLIGEENSMDAPLTLSFSTYMSLTMVYGSILIYRRHKLLVPWYWYVNLGFVDIHGKYLGSFFYAISNVGEEFRVKEKDQIEAVAMIGMFGMLMSGSTLFNLSLLTSDMWAVVIRTFFYKQTVDWLYYVAFILVVVGILIYSKIEKDPAEGSTDMEDASPSSEYYRIDQEISRDYNIGPVQLSTKSSNPE
ncbi:solute carrier family 35 member F1, partial [Striga asiatica]